MDFDRRSVRLINNHWAFLYDRCCNKYGGMDQSTPWWSFMIRGDDLSELLGDVAKWSRHYQRMTLTWYFVRYCGWKKSCTNSDGWNPINHGTNHLSTGGYLPSTVIMAWGWLRCPTPGHILDWAADASSPKKRFWMKVALFGVGSLSWFYAKLYLITSDNIKVIFDDIWLYLILIVGSTAIVGLSENRAPQSGEWAGVYPLVYPHFQTLFS